MKSKTILIQTMLLAILAVLFALPRTAAGAGTDRSSQYRILLQSRTIDPEIRGGVALPETNGRWHGLLQFHQLPDEALRQQLAQSGVELLAYVPHMSWIASFPADAAFLTHLPQVRWIGTLQPMDKMAPQLLDATTVDGLVGSGGQLRLWVRLFADADWAAARLRLQAAGVQIVAGDQAAAELIVATTPAGIWSIASDDAVSWILDERSDISTLNEESRLVSHADIIQAPPYNLSGAGIQVGMWDGGLVDAHPDFGTRLSTVGTAALNAHATHVAGTVGGDGSGGPAAGGTAEDYRGYADGADIISYYWSGPTTAHDQAINTAGIDVSQNSWGYTSCSIFGKYSIYANDYDDIIGGRYDRGIPVVFAAGNSNGSCGISYGSVLGGPSSAKNVITVGATNEAGDDMYSSSSRGPTVDGRLKPEVVAVGRLVYSTCLDGTYCGYNGTSMAAPAVSGSIALLAEQYANICPVNSSPWATAVPAVYRALLAHTAQDLVNPATPYLTAGPDFTSGYGRLDMAAAVDALPFHAVNTLSDGEIIEYTVTVATPQELKVTLAWDDAPATYNAAIAIINDLDLEVVGPQGVFYGPWQLDPANPALPATRPTWSAPEQAQPDSRNVLEQVVVDAAQPGVYTIRVRGTHVPSGPQRFALFNEQLNVADLDCQGAVASMGIVDIGHAGSDISLGWIHSAGNSAYEVWRHETPDLAPDLGIGTMIATVDAGGYGDGAGVSYVDAGVVGAMPQDYYYAVRAISTGGARETSGLVGKIDTLLSAGANNWVTLYFTDNAPDAAGFKSDIEAHSSAALTVDHVEQYQDAAGIFQLFADQPFVLGNFATQPEHDYRVAVRFDAGASSAVYTQVGAVPAGGFPGAQQAPQDTLTTNYHYGQLTGTPADARYTAWIGSGPQPAELLTDDAFNAGAGMGQGFAGDYWLLNLSNFSTVPAPDAALNMAFGDGSTVWSYGSSVALGASHGIVGAATGGSCPTIDDIDSLGDNRNITWTGTPGTYLVYRSFTGSGLDNGASNGRFQYLATVDTTSGPSSYLDVTSQAGWYIVVPADGSGQINGCRSAEISSENIPTAISLSGIAAGGPATTALPLGFIVILLVATAALALRRTYRFLYHS